ncbi:MAG: DUF308 domain-containing protein [Halobacteriota archaeon]
MAEEKTSGWLRIVEIIVGIIVLALGGYAFAYPGTAAATLIALLAIALIIIAIVEFVRIFTSGISGWQRVLNLILSVIAFLIALAILVYPVLAGFIALGWLMGLALLFLGAGFISSGTIGRVIVGIIAIIVAIVVLVLPGLGVGLAVLLLAIGLIILGIELIISGLLGRWV